MNPAFLALRLSAKKAKAVWQAACSAHHQINTGTPEEVTAEWKARNDLISTTYAAWLKEQEAFEALLSPQEKKLARLTYDFGNHYFERIPLTLRENKGRFLFRNLKKNGSNLEREILKFVKTTIRAFDAWDSFADGFEDFSLGYTGKDFSGVIEIPLDRVRRFRVRELQDYELEAIGARLRGVEIRENDNIEEYYPEDVFPHINEKKFKALYSTKIDGCDHDCIGEMEPDEVQECLNGMVCAAPAKIFDQGRCGICLEKDRLFALPCGCAVLCQGCAPTYVKSSQKRCPICRKGFTLAECCQQAREYEFSEEGLYELLMAGDDRGVWSCLDFTSFAQEVSDTDDLIELARKSFENCEEVEREQAQADYDKGFTINGEEPSTGGYFLCFEEIVEESDAEESDADESDDE